MTDRSTAAQPPQLIHTTSLTNVAEWLGVQNEYEEHRRIVKVQRRQWHAYLGRYLEPLNNYVMME